MIRTVLTCVLAGAAAFAQTATSVPPSGQSAPPAQAPRPVTPVTPPVVPGDNLPPDATVITIPGVCPGSSADAKSGACTTTITKEQFNHIVSLITYSNQPLNPAARRNFAQNYIQILAMADAAEKSGLDKDPKFAEMLKIMRVRALADFYRRSLEGKYSNPSDQDIEAYYKQNQAKFEQLQLDRLYIPRINTKNPNVPRADFEKKAERVANDMRERASKGEDITKLQAEAYNTLGLSSPPATDLGIKIIASISPVWQPEISALKQGEVTKVKSEPAGFTFYKLRARNVLPLTAVKQGIIREVSKNNMDAAIHAAMDSVHPQLNEQFFTVVPTGVRPPGLAPSPAPAAAQGSPSQKPAPPK